MSIRFGLLGSIGIAILSMISPTVKAQSAPYPDELQMILDTPLPPNVPFNGVAPPSYACGSITDIRIYAQDFKNQAFNDAITSFVHYGDRSIDDDGWSEVNDDWEEILRQLQEDLWELYQDWILCRFQNFYPEQFFTGPWCDAIPPEFMCVWQYFSDPPAAPMPHSMVPAYAPIPENFSPLAIPFCSYEDLAPPLPPPSLFPTQYLNCDPNSPITLADYWIHSFEIWVDTQGVTHFIEIPYEPIPSLFVTPRDKIMDLLDKQFQETIRRTFAPPFDPATYHPRLYNTLFMVQDQADADIVSAAISQIFTRVIEIHSIMKKGENEDRYNRPCVGDWDQSNAIDGDDVIAYVADWDNNAANADIDTDGDVDGDDMILWYSVWDLSRCF